MGRSEAAAASASDAAAAFALADESTVDAELQVFEFRKRKAAEEILKAKLTEEFAISRLEALIKFMELGDSTALFNKMNSRDGRASHWSTFQLSTCYTFGGMRWVGCFR